MESGAKSRNSKSRNNLQQENSDDDEQGHQFVMLNTRMLDNHWDPQVHGSNGHWKAPGKQPGYKYTYSKDSGLGFRLDNKFEQQIEKERSQLQEKQKTQSKNYHDQKTNKFRNFKELDNLNQDEIVITIEYCTNCAQHNSTTRHDEQKYLNQALSLQKEILKCFPVITVFLKPNVYDERDKSIDTIYIRQRCGAFDVQIAAGQADGQVVKGVLHSKLKTGKWADHASILSKIRHYMQKTNLVVALTLQDFDMSKIDQEQLRNPKVNKLYNVEVILKPKREKVSYNDKNQFQETQGGNNRPASAMSRKSIKSRPKSAMSQMSNKSRTQSQFGGSNPQEYDTKEDQVSMKTDENGVVVFEQIPYDVYHIEVQETNEFKQLKESVDIFEIGQGEENIQLQYELRHLNLTFLKIVCSWGLPASESEKQTMQTFAGQEGAEEQAKLIPREPLLRANLEVIPIRDGQEIEDETYDDTFNGQSEVTLLPGKDYCIRIFKKGYSTLDETVSLQPGYQELEFCVERSLKDYQQSQQRQQQRATGSVAGQYAGGSSQAAKPGRPSSARSDPRPPSGVKSIKIICYDGSSLNNDPIPNVTVEIREQKMKRNEQSQLTNEEGVCELTLQNILEGQLIISHPDYIDMVEEYGPSKFDITRLKELNMPLMKKPDGDSLEVRALTNCGEQVLSLVVINSEGQLISEGGEENDQIQISNSFENGNGYAKIKNISQSQGIFRIFAQVLSAHNLSPQQVKLFVLFNNQQLTVEVPKNINDDKNLPPQIWDIGFVNAPNLSFVEINAPCNQQPSQESHLFQYQQFIKFLNQSKADWKQILGFTQQDSLRVGDDLLQEPKKILESLKKYYTDDDQQNDILHILQSAKQVNGLISYQKLKAKLDRIKDAESWDVQAENKYEDDEEEQI